MFVFPCSTVEKVLQWIVILVGWPLAIVIIGWLLFSSVAGCHCKCRHDAATVAIQPHETPGANIQHRKELLEMEIAGVLRRLRFLKAEHEAVCVTLGMEYEPVADARTP